MIPKTQKDVSFQDGYIYNLVYLEMGIHKTSPSGKKETKKGETFPGKKKQRGKYSGGGIKSRKRSL